MAKKTVPYQCIWCLKDSSSANFSSESHVLPECIGNIAEQVLPTEQVLPKGVVCDACNGYFGRRLEPRLIEEPILSTLVAVLGFRDIGSQFTYDHSPSGVHRNIHMSTKVSANRITMTTKYEIEGQPSKPNGRRTISKSKDYNQRDLAFLSRAVHKIAFESVAHNLLVGTGIKNQSQQMGDIDIFDPGFNVIREWVRNGKPQHLVRPALRIQKFDEVERQEQMRQWGGKMWGFQGWIGYELNLFNDWYVVSLTSPANKVKGDLLNWLEKPKLNHPVWMVGDELHLME